MSDLVQHFCILLKIQTVSGSVYGMTNLDEDVDDAGDGVLYKSAVGATPSTFKSDNNLSVNTAELDAVIDVLGIDRAFIINGVFDYAEITETLFDFVDRSVVKIVSRGHYGESRLFKGHYIAELRSISQKLQSQQGILLSPTCRANLGDAQCNADGTTDLENLKVTGTVVDTNPTEAQELYVQDGAQGEFINPGQDSCTLPTFGTSKTTDWMDVRGLTQIKINTYNDAGGRYESDSQYRIGDDCLFIYVVGANVQLVDYIFDLPFGTEYFRMNYADANGYGETISVVDANFVYTPNPSKKKFTDPDLIGDGENIYRYGVVEFLTGNNAGAKMEVAEFDNATGEITLFEALFDFIEAGDTFTVYPGCDRLSSTCINQFDNIVNFRGEPDIPGQDKIMLYGGQGSGS